MRLILKISPKRVNFIAIQQDHAIPCGGYHQPTVRTGYDSVVAHRSYDMFAITAKEPGSVVSLDNKGIVVEYDSKQIQGYEIGRRFGNAGGLTIPHTIVTPLKVGDKFSVGDAIIYNNGFFEPDFFNPKAIVLKNSMNVRTVLWESNQTIEDASSISSFAAAKLMTNVTKVKTIVVKFDQSVDGLVKEGDLLTAESVLCTIQDATTANNALFDKASIDTLRMISAQTPRANVNAIVDRVEVFYHGDRLDMSESLKRLTTFGDKQLKSLYTSVAKPVPTGEVDGGFRIDGTPLDLDNVAIRIYLTTAVTANVGDKGVFCNQLKTVFSEVIEQQMLSEDGGTIDAIFGAKSIDDRIVSSPFVIGTTNTLLRVIAQKAVEMYAGESLI